MKKRKPKVSNEMKAQLLNGLPPAATGVLDNMIRNGLGSAIGYPGASPLSQFGAPLSSTNTLFQNLRWYLISNFRQLLSELYVEIGLIQTIVDVPVNDALRGGVTIKSKQLSEEQITELQISVDRDDDLNTIGSAAKWNRLFGGAGILVITDQDPALPLDLNAITKDSPLEIRDCDMWELFWTDQNIDGYDAEIQEENFETYNYYNVKLHKSRVMKLKGLKPPSFIRPRLRGWGFSVVETLVRSINQYLKATDLGFSVLDEFKVDVYKIKNLVSTLMSPIGQQKVTERIQMANWQKNYQNALIMDSEDEWDHKQLSFAGLAETIAGIRMQVAADMRMPICKLFGSQAGGLNPDDETDIEIYNSMVESEVRNKIKYDIIRVLEIKCQKLFQFIPEDLEIEFKPLRMLKATDEEAVKTSKFDRAIQAKTAGEITTEEFRDICNKDNLFPVKLDTSGAVISDLEDIASEEEGDNPKDTKDVEDPGADRADTRAPRAYDTQQTEMTSAEYAALKNVKPWTATELRLRLVNSAAFDRASYDADGGDSWIDERKGPIYDHPPVWADEQLWYKAKAMADKAGATNWQGALWFYKKLGGKVHE